MSNRIIAVAAVLLLAVAGCGSDDKASCDPTSCQGCCNAAGECVAGNMPALCGVGGAACVSCKPGEACNAGTCVPPCDSTTCPDGCCQNDTCMPGTDNGACGGGGMPCIICQGAEQCQNNGCQAPQTCDASSCATGCCDASGTCQPGNTNAACGIGGIPCVPCDVGQTCTNQVCAGGGSCGPANCADGCCDSADQCLPGNDNAACGTGGIPCAVCQGGAQCVNKACSGGGTCTGCTGCCDANNTCQPGNADDACGTGGQTCVACPTYKACTNAKCEIKPQSDWKVTVVQATIDPAKVWDPGALPGFTEPDIYVKVTCGGQTGESGTEDETYNPTFNDEVLTCKAQSLTQPVHIEVWDEDLVPPDQLVGQCDVPFTYGDLEAGQRTINNCGGPDVQSVIFGFAPK
jgi:hypothetical protein